jgi:hypothetical protein
MQKFRLRSRVYTHLLRFSIRQHTSVSRYIEIDKTEMIYARL